MATVIENEFQLQTEMTAKMYNVINATAQELLDKLKADIQSIVYDGNVPDWYTRTYEILNNWTCLPPEILGNVVSTQIAFTEPLYYSDADLWQHGIKHIEAEDLLKVIIGEEQWGICANFNVVGARDFWGKFIDDCNNTIDDIFLKYCKIYFGDDISVVSGFSFSY